MKTVVGVLRGGPSSEYEVSLKTGATVLEHLDREKYEPRDIYISRGGEWHLHGVPVAPERALSGVEVAVNAMHGQYGEDGQVQRLLDALAVPYTGSDAYTSALAFNKHKTREAVRKLGVRVAHGTVVEQQDDLEALALKLFRTLPHPVIVKPVTGGSSVGTAVADSYHALVHALAQAFAHTPKALVEEYIRGKEATVGVIDHFRSERVYALLPIEIIPPAQNGFYDYDAKYVGETRLVSPGNFTRDQKEDLMQIARAVHEGLNLSHYSRSDFIVSKRGIYFLEVNTLPGLTSHSNFPHALSTIGSKLSHFLDHIISLAKMPR